MQAPIHLTDLQSPTDYLTLELDLRGCFNQSKSQLRYIPAPQPHLRAVAPDGTLLSPVLLTPAQVALLENLLAYYRAPKSDGCTTSVTLRVTALRQGQKSRTEVYEDASCSLRYYEDAYLEDLKALKLPGAPTLSLRAAHSLSVKAAQQGRREVRYPQVPRKKTDAYQEVQNQRAEVKLDQEAHQMVERLEGYAQLCKEFRVESLMLGDINGLPYSLHTTLRALRPRRVDAVWWFDPVVHGKPRVTWTQFLKLYAEIERVTIRHTWLGDWKKAGRGRVVEAHIFGLQPWDEPDLARFVTSAWTHAGLQGLPRYALLLRRDDGTWARLYLGKDDLRGLIDSARPTKAPNQNHWLDRLELFYHPTQAIPEYVTVTPDGTPTHNERTK